MLVPGEIGHAKNIAKTSRKYGETIFQALLEEVKMKSKGIVTRKDLTGFNWSKVPVVLIEMGFLSNPEEDKLLNSEEYQNKVALGLAKGIDKILADKLIR
jgi:N-acetylmuramoyl-L-alanine amidase